MYFGLLAEDECRAPPQICLDSPFPDHSVLVSRYYLVLGVSDSMASLGFSGFRRTRPWD